MVTETNVKACFNLTESEWAQVENGFTVGYKSQNIFCEFCGNNYAKEAKKILKKHSVELLQERFGNDKTAKTDALATYILNELERCFHGAAPLLAEKLKLEEVIDCAPFGNGATLPLPPRSVVVYLLKHERKLYINELDAFKEEIEELKQQSRSVIQIAQDIIRSSAESRVEKLKGTFNKDDLKPIEDTLDKAGDSLKFIDREEALAPLSDSELYANVSLVRRLRVRLKEQRGRLPGR